MRIVHGLDVSRFKPSFPGHKASVSNIDAWFKDSPLYTEGARLLPKRCMARRVDWGVSKSKVGWHMDANLVGYTAPVLTAWIPLVEIDHETPGLEFACHGLSDEEAAKLWKEAKKRDGQVNDDELKHLVGNFTTVAPRLSPGSALVFNQFEIHRTEALTKHKPRVSVDIRFTEAP